MTVYVMPTQDATGERQVLKNPVQKEGATKIDLPFSGSLDYAEVHVISRNKNYLARKVAKAIAAGQIKIEDVRSAE